MRCDTRLAMSLRLTGWPDVPADKSLTSVVPIVSNCRFGHTRWINQNSEAFRTRLRFYFK
jgi:hypothetical protein